MSRQESDRVRKGPAGPETAGSTAGSPAGGHSRQCDCIIIAMARAFGYVLATRDAKILEYGSQGHVRVREAKRGRKAP